MTTLVRLKHVATGIVTEHFSVDAGDILGGGEYEQVGGPAIRFALPVKPKPEPGPPVHQVAQSEGPTDEAPPALDRPHMKHAGRGKWNVIDAEGKVVNGDLLDKPDAEALLATLE